MHGFLSLFKCDGSCFVRKIFDEKNIFVHASHILSGWLGG